MKDSLQVLYDTVCERKESPMEGSYTNYLFEQGLNKILKKCGEECTEVVIAAKGSDLSELREELCDLLYHLTVLMCEKGIALSEIEEILEQRSQKIKNKKVMKESDPNS